MTTPETARVLVLSAAASARIAGMQVANAQRLSLGLSVGYDEDSFFAEAACLEQLAMQVINQ